MDQQGNVDYLTKFYLRDSLNPFIDEQIRDCLGTKKHFSIALIDLDRFKRYNDRFGHPFGDELLQYASSILRFAFEEYRCRFFRYGGDEFLVVFLDKGHRETYRLVRTIRDTAIKRPFIYENRFYVISMSCGISSFPEDGRTAVELIQKADKALYFSKRHGRNLCTIASRMTFLRIRNIVLASVSMFIIIFVLYMLYELELKYAINPFFDRIKEIKVVTTPDVVILKNGGILRGQIIQETQEKVILKVYLEEGGEYIATLKMPAIETIQYGTGRVAD